jgi:hypothetical protein
MSILDSRPEITFTDVRKRFIDLYGDWSRMKVEAELYLANRYKDTPEAMEYMKSMLPPDEVNGATDEEINAMFESMCQWLIPKQKPLAAPKGEEVYW